MTQATNTTTIEVGMNIVFDGEVCEITSIKGRWVKLDTDQNISRAEAQEGRMFYLEDKEALGEELDDQEDAEEGTEEQEATDTPDESEEGDEEATGYQGSMLRLRERLAEGAYKKAENGQPCCGDQVATLLGSLAPAQVIRACIAAMALPSNPYAHLNVGQQSMNLRNKLRGCFKREEFGMGVLVEAVEEVKMEANIAHILSPEFKQMQDEILTAAAK